MAIMAFDAASNKYMFNSVATGRLVIRGSLPTLSKALACNPYSRCTFPLQAAFLRLMRLGSTLVTGVLGGWSRGTFGAYTG